MTYAILFCVGLGTLFPCTVFITERAYFDTRLTVHPYTPLLTNNFQSVFGIAYQMANLLTLGACVKYGAAQRLPRPMLVPVPLLVMAVLLLLTGCLTKVTWCKLTTSA